MHISITDGAFPFEEGDEISISEVGGRFFACFREEEISERFGEGDCPLLAAADLVLDPYREALR